MAGAGNWLVLEDSNDELSTIRIGQAGLHRGWLVVCLSAFHNSRSAAIGSTARLPGVEPSLKDAMSSYHLCHEWQPSTEQGVR